MSAPPLNGGIANDMFTSDLAGFRRLHVDVGQTGLFEGREFRLVRKVGIPAATPLVIRFTSAVDFILLEQQLNTTDGDIEFFAWRGNQGTAGGTFAGSFPVIGKNISGFYREYSGARYASQVTISHGGTFTPTDPEAYVDYDRAESAGATAQRVSVRGGDDSARYLAAGTYYLVLSSLRRASVGRFTLAWEERQAVA